MNEYVTSRVPEEHTTSGWQIALIKIGVVVALPGFLTGAELGSQLGLADAATAIVAGCLVLALICSLTGTVAAKKPPSHGHDHEIRLWPPWRRGSSTRVLAVTLIGWFAVTVELFARALLGMFEGALSGFLWSPLFVLGGGTLMLLTTLFGFRALAMLSRWAVPLMLLVLLVMAYVTATSTSLRELLDAPERTASMGIAIFGRDRRPGRGHRDFPRHFAICPLGQSRPRGRGLELWNRHAADPPVCGSDRHCHGRKGSRPGHAGPGPRESRPWRFSC